MDKDLTGIVDHFIEQQGAASFSVEDGHVLVFTTKTLEALLARSLESEDGRVVVSMQRPVTQ